MVLHASDSLIYSPPICLEEVEEHDAYFLYSPLREQQDLYVNLPEAALLRVFEYLDTRSLAAMLLLCKRWREVARASAASISLKIYDADSQEFGTTQVCANKMITGHTGHAPLQLQNTARKWLIVTQ